jgi:hypothetical protein
LIIVNKSVETRVTISTKDGTDKHVKSIPDKDVVLTGTMEDPRFQIKVLETAIAKIKSEMRQTTLPADDGEKKPGVAAPAAKKEPKK